MSSYKLFILKIPLILLTLTFVSCVSHHSVSPVEKTRSPVSALSFFLEQETAANSFIASGTISYSKNMRFDEGNFFAVGTLNPLKLKLEITHPLGGDIMHALLDKNNIKAVSFRERKAYGGEYDKHAAINNSLLADPSIAWYIFRGFPKLLPYRESYIEDNDKFSLLGNNSIKIQTITLEEGRMVPVSVGYNDLGIIVDTADFTNHGNIFYASFIKIASKNTDELIEVKFKSLEFDFSVTQEIFNIIIPSGFPILPFNAGL